MRHRMQEQYLNLPWHCEKANRSGNRSFVTGRNRMLRELISFKAQAS